MSKKGYLTAAEYRALRQLLGLTQEDSAKFHKVQNVRTIKRWEKGDSWVSEMACDKILALFEKVNWTINQAVFEAEKLPPSDTEIVLIIYPDSCYEKFAVGMKDLPNNVHQAMISRLYARLKEKGYVVGIVEFCPQDYFIYLAAHNMKDGQDARSQWACDYRKRLLIN